MCALHSTFFCCIHLFFSHMCLYPNGHRDEDKGNLSLFLYVVGSPTQKTRVKFTLSLLVGDGEKKLSQGKTALWKGLSWNKVWTFKSECVRVGTLPKVRQGPTDLYYILTFCTGTSYTFDTKGTGRGWDQFCSHDNAQYYSTDGTLTVFCEVGTKTIYLH